MGIFLKKWGRWFPFGLGVLWLAGAGMAGSLRVDLFHLWLCGLTGVAWLFARRLYVPAVLVVVLLAPLSLRLGALLPLEERPPGEWEAYTRVEGTVRGRGSLDMIEGARRSGAWLLLGEARVWRGGEQFRRAELEVRLPGVSHWGVPYRRRVRIGGRAAPSSSFLHGPPWRRPRVDFVTSEHHVRWEPLSAWRGESLRARLRDRAAYYLSPRALAVYLPVVLGMRERATPEAREVARAFRRVGVAHLFAISGLHVGLLYWMFAAALRGAGNRLLGRALPGWLGRWWLGRRWLGRRWFGRERSGAGRSLPGQGWVRAPGAVRGAAVAAIWVYIALIGFPISAVRAGLMVSMLVWNAHWGTRSPPLFILALAGLGMLAFAPSQLHDLSFQMSFLAYFFLLSGLGIYQGQLPAIRLGKRGATKGTEGAEAAESAEDGEEAGRTLPRRILHPVLHSVPRPALLRALRRVGEGVSINLWLTLLITLGLWPLVASVFGNLSLLVFFGNLVMIPPLSFAVLPLGLLGLVSTLICLNAAPGHWLERAMFAVLEPVLSGWVWLAEGLDRLGSGLVFRLELDWPVQAYFAYYAALLLLIGWARRWKKRMAGAGPAVPGP